MSWFSELDTREKVLVLGGGVLVGIFFIRGVKGKSSSASVPVDTTQQAQQTSDMASQLSQQQAAGQGSLMDALAQINTNMTQAIQDSNQQMAGAIQDNNKQMMDAQTQALSSITSLLGQMKTTQAVQPAQPYSIPQPTVAPATMVPQVSGGIISSPFVTHSFEVSKGDSWNQSGNTVTVHDSLGGVGTYNTDTHNSTWDYRNENIPSLSAGQVAQAKANAIAGKPLF